METKKELGITKGEWKQSHRKIPNDPEGMYSTQVYDCNGKTIATIAWYSVQKGNITTTTREGNAKLIADAGTTANKCHLLPSELLERYNEAIEALKEANKDLIVLHGNIYQELKKGNSQWDGVDEIIFKRIESNKQTISKSK